MTGRVRKLIIYGSVLTALGGAGQAVKQYLTSRSLRAQQIQPLDDGIYHGALPNLHINPEHLVCFEQMSAQKVDIGLRFMSFRELKSKFPFPLAEAKFMYERGGVLFIKLEPSSGKGPDDKTFSLDDILRGKFKKGLEAFAEECRDFGGPVFVTFGHEMNGKWYPWGQHPDYVPAFRYVHDVLSAAGAANITWVWNPNALGPGIDGFEKHYPGAAYVDWIAVNIFHHAGESVDEVISRLEKSIRELQKYGKPIMIGEIASSAPEKEKAEFIQKVLAKLKGWGIKGFVYFNVSKMEDSLFTTWSLREPAARAAYQQGLKMQEELFRRNIVAKAGELEDESDPLPKAPICEEVEQSYYTPYEAQRLKEIRETIEKNEKYLEGLIGGDPHYNNEKRIELARAYQEFYTITRDAALLEKAAGVLQEAMESGDPALVYHWEKKFIRDFFEVLLQMVNIYSQMDTPQGLAFCERGLKYLEELEKTKFFNAYQQRKESIPGYYHKAMALKAKILEVLGRTSEAAQLYRMIISWTESEAQKTFFSTWPFVWEHPWWRGETPFFKPWNRDDIRYDSASAKIRLGFIQTQSNAPDSAMAFFRDVLSWEKVGEEDGFMDLGFEALVGSLSASAQSSTSLAEAKAKFRADLPWDKINAYKDLKRALNLEEVDLTNPAVDVWETIVEGLSFVALPDRLKAEIIKARQHE